MLRVRRGLPSGLLPGAALGLYGVICLCYAWRWDRVAGLTVFPFWAWGLSGIILAGLPWLATRRKFAFRVMMLWLLTVLVFADESLPLLRVGRTVPEQGLPAPAPDGTRPRRVITLNCKAGFWNPASAWEVVPWAPDVVLFQESVQAGVLLQLAAKLYGGDPAGHVAGSWECGIVTRGRILRSSTSQVPGALMATIQFDDGTILEAISVHLRGAETDVRLYQKGAMAKHTRNRIERRNELQQLLGQPTLANMNGRAVLIGGDFNAPAGDAIFDFLKDAGFSDSMRKAGVGWPDTFPNAAPMLRIDYLWHSKTITPLRGRVVKSMHSDHRMVICDYLTGQPVN